MRPSNVRQTPAEFRQPRVINGVWCEARISRDQFGRLLMNDKGEYLVRWIPIDQEASHV